MKILKLDQAPDNGGASRTARSIAVALLCLLNAVAADARELYENERVALAYMGQVESALASALPGDCRIVATHPSPLGREFARMHFVRDAWVSRNGKVVAKVFLFAEPLPDRGLPPGAAVTPVRLQTTVFGKDVLLGVAVAGDDPAIVRKVAEIVAKRGPAADAPALPPGERGAADAAADLEAGSPRYCPVPPRRPSSRAVDQADRIVRAVQRKT